MMPPQPTTSVSWPATAAPVATAAPAVVQVAPAAPAARDGQASLEQRFGRPQGSRPGARAAVDTEPAEATRQAAETALRQRAETELRAQELERLRLRQEAQAETVEQLRQALLRIWEASAAVVEQVQAQSQGAETPSAQGALQALKAYEGGDAPREAAGSLISQRV